MHVINTQLNLDWKQYLVLKTFSI